MRTRTPAEGLQLNHTGLSHGTPRCAMYGPSLGVLFYTGPTSRRVSCRWFVAIAQARLGVRLCQRLSVSIFMIWNRDPIASGPQPSRPAAGWWRSDEARGQYGSGTRRQSNACSNQRWPWCRSTATPLNAVSVNRSTVVWSDGLHQ